MSLNTPGLLSCLSDWSWNTAAVIDIVSNNPRDLKRWIMFFSHQHWKLISTLGVRTRNLGLFLKHFRIYHHARSRHWISVHKIKSPLCYDENCIQPTMQWLCSVSQTMCFGICTINICKAKCSNMRLWSMAIIKFAMTTFMGRYELRILSCRLLLLNS